MAGDATRPYDATRWIETSRGLLSYAELAPLLAERVLRVQQKLEGAAYANAEFDENLLRQLHADFCGDLVRDWAGRWRAIAVRVGSREPPPPHLVAEHMRNYAGDLQAQLSGPLDLTLLPEHLAFAEERLLTIHPFQDFNGRLARLWLWEILRRLELPPVDLVPPRGTRDAEKYLAALGACDAGNLHPLTAIWQERLSRASSIDA